MNNYKLHQLMFYFMVNHGYKKILINKVTSDNEILLLNKDNNDYQIIRLTTNTLDGDTFNQGNVESIVNLLGKLFKIENPKLLTIHVSNEEITSIDKDCLCIDVNHYSGEDLSYAYPKLKTCIHEVDDPELEINNINSTIEELSKSQLKNKINNNNGVMISTYIIMGICLLLMLVVAYLEYVKGYELSNCLIFLGANYSTFTVGLNQYWRLLTAGFLHLNIFHLLVNMYSFYFLARSLKSRVNALQYLAILFLSIIIGSLTSVVFNENILSAGISGGLYGLFIYYFMDVLKNNSGMLNYRSIILTLLPLILINFMSSIDVYGHLGGALCGMMMFFIFNNEGITRYLYIFSLVVIIIALVYFMLNITIYPLYYGTDTSVINMIRNINTNYGNKLFNKLMEVYTNYGN